MAVTTHHRQRYVTLTNTTQLWGDRCGRKEMTLKCPPGARRRGLGSVAAPRRPSRGSRGAGRGVSELTRLPYDTAAPADKLRKQKKSRFINSAKAALSKEPGKRSRREQGWFLRSAATSQRAVMSPGQRAMMSPASPL